MARYVPPYDFGLGGVAIGNEFRFATDEQAEATLAAAWDAGLRYFDVSPWYGLGLAERRYGRFLARRNRRDFVISSKVGKLLKAGRDNDGRKYFPYSPSPNSPVFDYTADGVRRSVEDSLQRLGLDRLDIVFVHDLSPDNQLLPQDWEELWRVAERGAFPALTRMREEGLIDAWGMGVNCPQPILRCLETADSDVHLLASQYSLIDHANAVEEVLPAARAAGVTFVMGSALNAGFLSGEPHYNYGDDNTLIAADKRAALATLKAVAARHGTDLLAAALQFALAPDVAASLIVGAARPEHILADHAALRAKIDPAFWEELRAEGVLHPDAAIPPQAPGAGCPAAWPGRMAALSGGMADLPFRRVIYRSRATGGTARADLPAILAQSRLNNGLDGLSGLLWTDGDRYLQLLEGPPESVAATLARILADPRHHDVEFASDTAEAERAFGDWTMADLGADAAEERLAVALADAPPAVKAVFAQAR